MYCNNYKQWRLAVANYYSIEQKEAKKILISLFFGANPRSDIPFLWKLKQEIDEAVEIILNDNDYLIYKNYFSEKLNPNYTRISYIIAEKEN